MELKTRVNNVETNDPFASDKLGRESEILNLTPLLKNVATPFVLAIDGRWGAGKTTFISMWSAYLERNHFSVMTFNAWETDFSEDPLVAFLGEMNARLKSMHLAENDANQSWEQCKEIGGVIARKCAPALIRLVTGGIVDGQIGDEVKGLLGGLASDAVDSYESIKNDIDNFKKLLAETLVGIGSDLPFIVFVDELDRCRPTYSIELLERIKHLFDQSGIVFVLALDKEQLCHSIKAVYGEGLDAQGYLQRFIDLEYLLGIPTPTEYIEYLCASLDLDNYFSNRNKINSSFLEDKNDLISSMQSLNSYFSFSLREVEQQFTRIKLALLATPDEEHAYVPLIVLLVNLRQKQSSLYMEIKKVGAFTDGAYNFIEPMFKDNFDKDNFQINAVILALAYACDRNKSRIDDRYRMQKNIMDHADGMRYKNAEIIYNILRYYKNGSLPIKAIIRRIELSDNFNLVVEG